MSLVTVNQLTKSYGKEHAVRDVSFALENGRCTALLGPNGAGKTTILKMLSGLLKLRMERSNLLKRRPGMIIGNTSASFLSILYFMIG